MKQVFNSQKNVSTLVAICLAGMITFLAATSSFGVTSDEDVLEAERVEAEIVNRALADSQVDLIQVETSEVENIKIFNADNQLITSVTLNDGKKIEDKNIQELLNRSSFLSKDGNTSLYRISE